MTFRPPYLLAPVLRARALYEAGLEAAWTNPRSRIPDITGYSEWDRCSYWLGVRAALRYGTDLEPDPTEPRHRRVLVVAPRAYDRAKHGPHLPMDTDP